MSDRLQEIRARLDAAGDKWWRMAEVYRIGYRPGCEPYTATLMAHAPDDLAYLLSEVEKWKERAKVANPLLILDGAGGPVRVCGCEDCQRSAMRLDSARAADA